MALHPAFYLTQIHSSADRILARQETNAQKPCALPRHCSARTQSLT